MVQSRLSVREAARSVYALHRKTQQTVNLSCARATDRHRPTPFRALGDARSRAPLAGVVLAPDPPASCFSRWTTENHTSCDTQTSQTTRAASITELAWARASLRCAAMHGTMKARTQVALHGRYPR
jgi:hypothetical protein